MAGVDDLVSCWITARSGNGLTRLSRELHSMRRSDTGQGRGVRTRDIPALAEHSVARLRCSPSRNRENPPAPARSGLDALKTLGAVVRTVELETGEAHWVVLLRGEQVTDARLAHCPPA